MRNTNCLPIARMPRSLPHAMEAIKPSDSSYRNGIHTLTQVQGYRRVQRRGISAIHRLASRADTRERFASKALHVDEQDATEHGVGVCMARRRHSPAHHLLPCLRLRGVACRPLFGVLEGLAFYSRSEGVPAQDRFNVFSQTTGR